MKGWQLLSNAPNANDKKRVFRVTHPFHPWRGREFELVDVRLNWGEERVYYVNENNKLDSLPACWTDVLSEDPFIIAAKGQSHFRSQDLQVLRKLIDSLTDSNPKRLAR